MFNREARTAGRKPPSKPISREKPSEVATIDGDSAKENASSVNEPKFSVEIEKNCSTDANPRPNKPPPRDSANDSIKKATRMLRR